MSINWIPIDYLVDKPRCDGELILIDKINQVIIHGSYIDGKIFAKTKSSVYGYRKAIRDKRSFSHYAIVNMPSQLASDKKLAQEEIFSMFDGWQPGGSFPEKILHEFKSFWCAKPEVKRTQEQWMKYLLLSYNYAVNRDMANKPDTSTGWWRDGELKDD